MGHALKLSHVFSDSFYENGSFHEYTRYWTERYGPYVWCSEVLSIMNNEAAENEEEEEDYPSLNTIFPSFLDKYYLIQKWGV